MHAGRVLLVEDEASISEPLCELLRLEGYDAVVASTMAEGLAMAQQVGPDLVLLDLMLPDGNGRDLCRSLRRSSDVPIIMLTARGQVHDRIVGLELGADDYVTKPFDGAEVIARIGAILRRVGPRSSGRESGEPPQTIGALRVDPNARQVWLGGAQVRLTRKEFDLLSVLVRHAGRVVRREMLISEVWDENWWGSTRTLDVHVGTLRRKLGDAGSAPRLIETVRGVGFRLCPPEEPPSV